MVSEHCEKQTGLCSKDSFWKGSTTGGGGRSSPVESTTKANGKTAWKMESDRGPFAMEIKCIADTGRQGRCRAMEC